MSVHPGDVDKLWVKLGFAVEDKKRDVWATLVVGDQVILRTKRSKGAKGTSGNISHFIRQQMKLNEDQFQAAIACPLTREDYYALLREKGFIQGESPQHGARAR